jgi:hypothetical protein
MYFHHYVMYVGRFSLISRGPIPGLYCLSPMLGIVAHGPGVPCVFLWVVATDYVGEFIIRSVWSIFRFVPGIQRTRRGAVVRIVLYLCVLHMYTAPTS